MARQLAGREKDTVLALVKMLTRTPGTSGIIHFTGNTEVLEALHRELTDVDAQPCFEYIGKPNFRLSVEEAQFNACLPLEKPSPQVAAETTVNMLRTETALSR